MRRTTALAPILTLAATSCLLASALAQPTDTAAGPDWRVGAQRFGVAQAPVKAEGTIRIATYNIENMFDGVDDPVSPRDDVEWEKPAEEVAAVAAAIRALGADILAIQEIESEDVLRAFRDEHLKGMGYDHLASIDTGDQRGIEQGILSRFPITEAKSYGQVPLGGIHPEKYGNQDNWYAGEPINFRRGPLQVTIEIPAQSDAQDDTAEPYPLTLFNIHHKSGRYNGYWREAEAKKLVEIIATSGLKPSDNIVILGDFNAQMGDGVIEQYLDLGFRDIMGHAAQEGPDAERDPKHVTHESGRAIDHLLVSAGMTREIVRGSAFVLGTTARQEGISYRDYPPPEGYAADHYPVAVDIRPRDGGTR